MKDRVITSFLIFNYLKERTAEQGPISWHSNNIMKWCLFPTPHFNETTTAISQMTHECFQVHFIH